MDNLSISIRELFTHNVALGLGKMLNEPEVNINKALDTFIPTAIAGLFHFSKTASENSINEMISGAQNLLGGSNTSGVSVLENMAAGKSDYSYWIARGNAWLKEIFENKLSLLTENITQNSGIKNTTTPSLMGLIMPFIVDIINQKTGENTATGLTQLLQKSQNGILAAVPAASGIAKLLGWSTDNNESNTNMANSTSEDKRKSESAWAWMLLLALGGLAAWYFLKGDNNMSKLPKELDKEIVQKDTTPSSTNSTPSTELKGKLENGNWIYDVGTEKEIKLADGTVLRVGENSTEARLFAFLSDANVKVADDKTQGWITLDRVYFETGKDVLVPSSLTQLKNIAMILKNFPAAKVKMGGYTDNTGSDKINIPLSDKRAKIAAAEIQKQGVAKDNISAEGYGSQHPVCPANNTDECKAQNRRVDIRVTAK